MTNKIDNIENINGLLDTILIYEFAEKLNARGDLSEEFKNRVVAFADDVERKIDEIDDVQDSEVLDFLLKRNGF